MTEESAEAGGDRKPSNADRPPVSRVGDELQQKADALDGDSMPDERVVEREAFEAAQEKGWDKPLKNDDS